MNCQFFSPGPALRPYVEQYIFLTPSSDLTRPERIPPGGKSGLTINLGADYRAQLAGVSQRLPPVALGGQLTQMLTLDKPADGQVLQIIFQPTGLYRVFGLTMAELTNQIIPINELITSPFGQSWYSLADQLREIRDNQERIRRVEAYLLAYVRRLSPSRSTWVEAASAWLAQPGDRRIQRLVTELRISPRQLTRVFGQQVGMTPKDYAQIMRFRNVFRAATAPVCPPWQDLVHAGGWYDQSHFCNDFCRMTGQTPAAFFAQHHAIAEIMINQS